MDFSNFLSSDWVATYDLLLNTLLTIGMFGIFKKCNERMWWAIIPIARTFKLAQCADREEEGKIWCICDFLLECCQFSAIVFKVILETFPQADFFLSLLTLIVSVMSFVYSIRVFSGLCTVFGKKRRNVILWIFFDGIVSIIWGFSKKYQPVNRSVQNDDELIAAGESNYVATEIKEGLTVNIKARKARSFFKTKTLLKDIHLNIEPGNMVLLLGGSGAGKTTFVNAVTGYEKADAKILLDGEDVYTRFDKMKYKIGLVPQQDLIRYQDTVYRTLADAATLRLPGNVTRKERRKRIDEVLDIFGLTPVKGNIVAKQSGGQKKRISIATEFISDPSLFILDEPDSGLDGILARDLMNRLHEISRQGKIVVVITHTPDRVIDLFDKVIVLGKDAQRTGRLVFYGSIEEARTFFGKEKMEDIVRMINREDEGGEGKSDELIEKYAEVCNARA